MMVPDDDPEMDAAIQRARTEVGTFIARLEAPQVGDEYFSVKVPLRDGEQVEHFWLDEVRHEKGMFRGTLGNDPELVKGHKYGEPITGGPGRDLRLDVREQGSPGGRADHPSLAKEDDAR